ncbi:MAG: cupredoxin domain-containing protein [Thermomicrobiales bacterium]
MIIPSPQRNTVPLPVRPLLGLLLVLLPLLASPAAHGARAVAPSGADLPVVRLDALDPSQWSLSSLRLAPGQKLEVTNRGLDPHTFTVAEWGVSIDLPSLETVTVTVPETVQPGQVFMFYCAVGDHRRQGQQGMITIVSADDARADATPAPLTDEPTITLADDFTFTPASISAPAGSFIRLVNTGVLEHHFVVDEWNMNVTVPPGETTVIRVPGDVAPGTSLTFYCSMPGHRDRGMQGTITVEKGTSGPTGSIDLSGAQVSDNELLALIPAPESLGPGWSELRNGDAQAISPDLNALDVRIFPGDGRSAVYIGPDGAHAVVIVLPLVVSNVPTNQVESGMFSVQQVFMQSWETDVLGNTAYSTMPNPPGCDIVSRTTGITKLYTLPAGSTSCQMRGPGIAIFVAVEGVVDGRSGVEASDELVRRIIADAP